MEKIALQGCLSVDVRIYVTDHLSPFGQLPDHHNVEEVEGLGCIHELSDRDQTALASRVSLAHHGFRLNLLDQSLDA